MNNAQALKFTNEGIRPVAERLRQLRHDLDDLDRTWQGGIAALFLADMSAAVEDGRDAEGISRLTCNDVVLVMAQVEAVQAVLNGAGVPEVISKPCVRI